MKKPETITFHYGDKRRVIYPYALVFDGIREAMIGEPALTVEGAFDVAIDIVKDKVAPKLIEIDYADGNTFSCPWERFAACLARSDVVKIADLHKMLAKAVDLVNAGTDTEPAK